ncbi:hypothetical protein Pmani_011113 [Petrolisthes manimaculis]|uniref:Uncharacterized protein n=1 Tax=Petrolisthes manimaculis TaxID=1843537 RepID=A0AAE1Q1S4_9EUCA|nr:hypothetical protein Pmani_011113 [Petrolisthes manimaculis]
MEEVKGMEEEGMEGVKGMEGGGDGRKVSLAHLHIEIPFPLDPQAQKIVRTCGPPQPPPPPPPPRRYLEAT